MGGGLVFVLRIKNYETLLYTTEFLKNKHIFKDVEFPLLLGILKKINACMSYPPNPSHMVYVFLGKELSLHVKQEPETMLSTVSSQWCMC